MDPDHPIDIVIRSVLLIMKLRPTQCETDKPGIANKPGEQTETNTPVIVNKEERDKALIFIFNQGKLLRMCEKISNCLWKFKSEFLNNKDKLLSNDFIKEEHIDNFYKASIRISGFVNDLKPYLNFISLFGDHLAKKLQDLRDMPDDMRESKAAVVRVLRHKVHKYDVDYEAKIQCQDEDFFQCVEFVIYRQLYFIKSFLKTLIQGNLLHKIGFVEGYPFERVLMIDDEYVMFPNWSLEVVQRPKCKLEFA